MIATDTKNSKLPMIFSTWISNRSCQGCSLLPLCHRLSYKEIAIIQLFLLKAKEGRHFFPLTEFHESFLKYYIYERDGYTTFYNIINDRLVMIEGLLLKINLSKISPEDFGINVRGYKQNEILYTLNPSYALNLIDFDTDKTLCPIGMNPLCYQILEILVHENGITSKKILKILENGLVRLGNNNNSKKLHVQTVRRRLSEMNAVNLILVEKDPYKKKANRYYFNPAHFLLNTNSDI
ncbi:MAG: hypothetical protein ACFFFG_11795 [Candidatus Thorarchaeota archaeon]